ncbi:MAG TPA: hypothetical protein VJZ91_02300 [Blastocatellia bacterium]|nr:hypothetical protein [Blastocatellia bacterium]
MTTSNDDSTQGRGIFRDEERQVVMRDALEHEDQDERREALVDLLQELSQRLGEHGEGWQQVSVELHRLVEWLFKGSETYELALELYERRFSLVGARGPAEVLRMVLDEQLKPRPHGEQALPAVTQTETEAGSRFSPEQYRKRLEVASAAILGTDVRRIDCMHGCLTADAATLTRALSLLKGE